VPCAALDTLLCLLLFAAAAARNLFSAVVGFAVVYYPFGSHVVHGVITSLSTYLVMWLVPRKCGTLAWLICFPYLTVL
jgi:lysophospholipid acyltransferase